MTHSKSFKKMALPFLSGNEAPALALESIGPLYTPAMDWSEHFSDKILFLSLAMSYNWHRPQSFSTHQVSRRHV